MEKDIDKTYVGMLDILGFTELASNNDHQELKKIYEIFDRVVKQGLTLFQDKIESGEFLADESKIKINSLIISDSIILWTDNLKYHNFNNLLLTVRAILSESMRCGIPLRGSIVVGAISIKEERLPSKPDNLKLTCFGKSIVDAYVLGGKQNWSGCVITSEAIKEYENSIQKFKDEQTKYTNERIDNALLLTSLERKFLVRKYLVPYKSDKLTEETVINWVNEFDPKWSESAIRNSFNKHNKTVDNWKVETIIRNTISFANDCPESPLLSRV